MSRFERTELMLGSEQMNKLRDAHVIVFGIGGVGGYVVEALVRSGVGQLTLVDRDTVSESNINRQIIALTETIGRPKTCVMKERALSINPDAVIECREEFFLPESTGYDFTQYSYVVDAVDTVTAKLEIIKRAYEAGVPVISSMGTGNKLHPELFRIADIEETKVCPLARVMRRELKNRGIHGVRVLYSEEQPLETEAAWDEESGKKIPGSIAFVPPVAGLMIAGEVIRTLCQ